MTDIYDGSDDWDDPTADDYPIKDLTLQNVAETIHKARWPADRQLAVTPFEDEDRNGREYCFRIARAIIDQYGVKQPGRKAMTDHALLNELTIWFDTLDFDRSSLATRIAEYAQMEIIVNRCSPAIGTPGAGSRVSQEALDWAADEANAIEQYKAANPDWEKDCKPAREAIGTPDNAREALEALYEWYDRDGSVGGASEVFEKHRRAHAAIPREQEAKPVACKRTDITKEMALAGRKALALVADRMEEAKLLATSSIDFWQRVGHEPANEIYAAMVAASLAAPPSDSPGSAHQPQGGDARVEVHGFVQVYNFCFDGGGIYTPTDRDKAMVEDAINCYIAECEQAAATSPAPVRAGPIQGPLPGLVTILRSHADDCENMERWATPELAPLLRRAADVIEAGVAPVRAAAEPGEMRATWRLVPKKPTNAMLKAACAAMSPAKRPTPDRIPTKEKHRIRYRAMISAAPTFISRGDLERQVNLCPGCSVKPDICESASGGSIYCENVACEPDYAVEAGSLEDAVKLWNALSPASANKGER